MSSQSDAKNIVKVTRGDGRVGKYLKYVHSLFNEGEKPFTSCTIKGAGHAISVVVPLVELIKRKIKGLHQTNTISHFETTDEPRFEGEEARQRRIVVLTVELTLDEPDTTAYGY